ncbi:MAG: M20/M25/M40 family metallo-hydrolase [Planctomycetota bacterium]
MSRYFARVTTGLLAVLILLGGCHQPSGPSIDGRLIGEVMMHSELAANLRTLAVPGGRLSGSPNGHQAEQFVAEKLREYGLRNVHFEPFEMTTWRDRRTVVTVLDDPLVTLEEALALGNSLSTPPEGITAEVADVGNGGEEDFRARGDALRGKFALVREGGPHRGRKMRWALQHGAVGLVQVSPLEDRPRVGTCHAEPRPEPGVAVRGSDGEALVRRLAAGETVRLNVQIEADAWACRPSNVVAEIPGLGRLADEIVILCAHLDSWHLGEGVIDNGNGSAAILETARTLTCSGWKPRRTVRFIWFMGEEHGLHGSEAYVKDHADELDRLVAVVNVDMPGAPRQFATFGHAEIVDFLKLMQERLAGFQLSEEIANATWTSSDHAAFMKQGVCALALYGDVGPGAKFYHSAGDKYEQVDLRGTTQSAAVLAVLVRQLADCTERPTLRLAQPALPAEVAE